MKTVKKEYTEKEARGMVLVGFALGVIVMLYIIYFFCYSKDSVIDAYASGWYASHSDWAKSYNKTGHFTFKGDTTSFNMKIPSDSTYTIDSLKFLNSL